MVLVKQTRYYCLALFLFLSTTSSANLPDVFKLQNLQGETVELSDFRGKVVVVNFWATWCPPCVHELPSLQALYDSMSGAPFELLGLNMAEDAERISTFLAQFDTKLTFPILLRADQVVAHEWKVRGLPTTIIFDKNGDRAYTWQGPKDWNSSEVHALIQPLLAQ